MNGSITRKEEWDAICKQFYPYLLNWLKSNGTSVDEIETYEGLDGVTSLPARLELGGVRKNVLVPLRALTSLNDTAAEAANDAAYAANVAATRATSAAQQSAAALNELNIVFEELKEDKALILSAAEESKGAVAEINRYLEHPPKVGDGGTWMIWDDIIEDYADTRADASQYTAMSMIHYDNKGGFHKDAVFVDKEGRYFLYNGLELMRAGISQEEADLLELSRWIKMESEEDMDALLESGGADDGKIRYLAEE